jgi:hypothetical protein
LQVHFRCRGCCSLLKAAATAPSRSSILHYDYSTIRRPPAVSVLATLAADIPGELHCANQVNTVTLPRSDCMSALAPRAPHTSPTTLREYSADGADEKAGILCTWHSRTQVCCVSPCVHALHRHAHLCFAHIQHVTCSLAYAVAWTRHLRSPAKLSRWPRPPERGWSQKVCHRRGFRCAPSSWRKKPARHATQANVNIYHVQLCVLGGEYVCSSHGAPACVFKNRKDGTRRSYRNPPPTCTAASLSSQRIVHPRHVP